MDPSYLEVEKTGLCVDVIVLNLNELVMFVC